MIDENEIKNAAVIRLILEKDASNSRDERLLRKIREKKAIFFLPKKELVTKEEFTKHLNYLKQQLTQ